MVSLILDCGGEIRPICFHNTLIFAGVGGWKIFSKGNVSPMSNVQCPNRSEGGTMKGNQEISGILGHATYHIPHSLTHTKTNATYGTKRESPFIVENLFVQLSLTDN